MKQKEALDALAGWQERCFKAEESLRLELEKSRTRGQRMQRLESVALAAKRVATSNNPRNGMAFADELAAMRKALSTLEAK